jgi:hypothetical protein
LFRDDSEIIADLNALLPTWADLSERRKEPISLKPNIHFRPAPVAGMGEDRRYEVSVTVENDGEQTLTDYSVSVEFPLMFVDGTGYLAMKPTSKPGIVVFEGNNTNQKLDTLYPGAESTAVVSFFCGVPGKMRREHPEQLKQSVKAIVSSPGMKPTIVAKAIAELMHIAETG